MDQASTKSIIWYVAQGILANHKTYSKGQGRITHDIRREDLGIQLVRYAEHGIENTECIALFHEDYIVAVERQWPLWGDRAHRKIGKRYYYVSGDYHKIREAAAMLALSK